MLVDKLFTRNNISSEERQKMNDEFKLKVFDFLKKAEKRHVCRIRAERVKPLAEGVFAVEDSQGDVEIYFDKTRWSPTTPETLGMLVYPPDVAGSVIGILFSHCGLVLDQALEFAKEQLHPLLQEFVWNPGEARQFAQVA